MSVVSALGTKWGSSLTHNASLFPNVVFELCGLCWSYDMQLDDVITSGFCKHVKTDLLNNKQNKI